MNKIIKDKKTAIKLFSSIAVILLLCMCLGLFIIKLKSGGISDDIYVYNGKQNIECIYYNATDFMNIPEYRAIETEGTVRGLIVPHHLLAKDLIHEAFRAAGENRYKTVVIFGPDHESTDMGKVFTSDSSWQTPFGILNSDKDAVKSISELDFVLKNDAKMTAEHSLSGLVPFIRYYYDEAKIIPLALTKQLTLENSDRLIKKLTDSIDTENTLFIASVDFSHYLSLEKANEMDKISIEAINGRDMGKIMSFTNDNLDSPNSIAAILKLTQLTGAKNIKLLNNSNSQIILNKMFDETTSYVTFIFE